MSDRETFIDTNSSEVFPDREPLIELTQEQKEPKSIVFYDEKGRAISFELPSDEEIEELLYRLENGDIVI